MEKVIKIPKKIRYFQLSEMVGSPKASKKEVLSFFGVNYKDEVVDMAESYCNQYLSFNSGVNHSEVNPFNLYGIVHRIKYEAHKTIHHIDPDNPDYKFTYNPEQLWDWVLEKSWMINKDNVRRLKNIPHILKPFGVLVYFIPFIPNTVYGGVEWIDGIPIIVVTDRRKDLAMAWFTLFKCLFCILNYKETAVWFPTIAAFPKENDIDFLSDEYAADQLFMYNGKELRNRILAWKDKCEANDNPIVLDELDLDALIKGLVLYKSDKMLWFWARKVLGFYPETRFDDKLNFQVCFNPIPDLGFKSSNFASIKDKVLEILKASKINRSELARRLGVTKGFISLMFSGKKPISKKRMYQIIEICQLNINFIS